VTNDVIYFFHISKVSVKYKLTGFYYEQNFKKAPYNLLQNFFLAEIVQK